MTRYEELRGKQKAALIVVLTLGLAAVPVTLNWNNNIFEGTSFDHGVLGLICKVVSFLILMVLCAVPAFVIYLIVLIITTIKLSRMD